MNDWIGVAAIVVGWIAVDVLLAWMHQRGWIYWEGLTLLVLDGLARGAGRYPERLNDWKRQHPRLRVTAMDTLVQCLVAACGGGAKGVVVCTTSAAAPG